MIKPELRKKAGYIIIHVRTNDPTNKTKSFEVIVADVPERFIFRPLLFNLFISNIILFLYTTVLSNYADDNNLYAIGIDKKKTK